ncbi:MAG: SprT-like domain-containing protein [Bacteroidota bacterium]|nr:SprT-like domain-containing protein [Bacteroidota bacterium]
MDQLTRNQSILAKYIPEQAVPLISEWILHFNFKLKIKKSRQSKYGDYRPPLPGLNHQITINQDLNRYAFLLTLVHEIAHLLTQERYGNRVKPHGEEWKNSFKELMRPFMRMSFQTTNSDGTFNPDQAGGEIFPEDVFSAIIGYMQNPAASSCSDDNLLRTLKRYDKPSEFVHLETLPLNAVFIYNKRYFIKGQKIRKRYKCLEKDARHVYLFAGLAEVKLFNDEGIFRQS